MNRFVAIDIGQLRIGMYVHLEMGWLSHPFPVNSFKITTQEQLQTLQALKLSHIQYDPRRSDASLPQADDEVLEPRPLIFRHFHKEARTRPLGDRAPQQQRGLQRSAGIVLGAAEIEQGRRLQRAVAAGARRVERRTQTRE